MLTESRFEPYLAEKLKSRYEKYFNDDFDNIRIILASELENISKDVDGKYKEIIKKVRYYKNRYIEKFITNKKTNTYKKLLFAREEYNDVLNGKRTLESFEKYFGASSIEEYEKLLFKDIYEWKSNDEALLSECPFLDTMHKLSIKTVFKNDVMLLYCRFLKEKNMKELNIKRFPTVFGSMPIDTTNRLKYIQEDIDDSVDNLMGMETIDKIIENSDSRLIIQLENNLYNNLAENKNTESLMTQIALLKAIKAMNDMDKQIISYFFNIFYMSPMDNEVIKYTYEIAEGCNYSKSKNNLDAIEASILKLSKIRLEHTVEIQDVSKEIVGTLIEATIDKYKNKKNQVKVKCGSFLQELIITNSSYNFNKESFDELNKDSQQFALWFQKRRLNRVYEMKEQYSEDVYDVIPIVDVMKAILWNTIVMEKRIRRTKNSVEDLKKNELVIRDWKYDSRKQLLSVLYIPLPKFVIKNILEKNFKEGSFIEGNIIK